MKLLLIGIVMILAPVVAKAQQLYDWPIIRVVDADTLRIEAPWLPQELGSTISLRLYTVDAPEKGARAKCDQERELSVRAMDYVADLIFSKPTQTQIQIKGWDKYGGRILGDVFVDGKSLTEDLLSRGYVRPYFGSGEKPNWCQ